MKPSAVKTTLETLINTRWPAFIWGPPGAGKSSIVKEAASGAGLELLDVRASLLDPTDLRGIPAIEDGASGVHRAFGSTSSGVLFFDELNAAPPLVQVSLYQLTLDRRVGEYELPRGWRILAAGNRAEDSSITVCRSSQPTASSILTSRSTSRTGGRGRSLVASSQW